MENIPVLEPDITVTEDKNQRKRLMSILLENAVKSSEPGSDIRIALRREPPQAVFSVHNTGSALSNVERERIFDRFYTGDASRSSAGYDLGLSIAKSIMDVYKGRIWAKSATKKETVFL